MNIIGACKWLWNVKFEYMQMRAVGKSKIFVIVNNSLCFGWLFTQIHHIASKVLE